MIILIRIMALTVLLTLLSGCKQSVQMVMNLQTPANFFSNGFPTDLREQPDGHIDLSDFPRQKQGLTRLYVETTEQQIKGYGLSMPVYLPFTGALDMGQLPADEAAFAQADSPIQLIDIDPASPDYGRRYPLDVTMTWQPDSYRPNHLLELLPTLGLNLRPNTTYAAIVSSVMAVPAGMHWQQNTTLHDLLTDNTGNTVSERVLTVFAPLRDWLGANGIDPDTIMAATVWRTGNPTAKLYRAAAWLGQWQAPVPTDLHVKLNAPDYCVLAGHWQVPGFQQGTPPYIYPVYGGDFVWDNGLPQPQYRRNAPFVITIPRTPMPASGFPLLLYNHGTGGKSTEVYTRGQVFADGMQDSTGGPARIAARRGWAAADMGGHFGSEHFADYHLGIDPKLNSYLAYNFLNPVAWRSNMQQMVLEEVLFRRLLNGLQIDPALCPDAANGSAQPLHFNTGMEALMGQSLGSYVAGMQAAVDPVPYQGLILSGAGGSWLEFPFGPTDPVPLQYVVEFLGLNFSPVEHLDVWHPVLMLAEMLVGSADNILYTDSLIRHPRKSPPDILVIEGHRDHQVTDNIQRPLLMSLDVDLAGSDQGTTQQDSILWYLQIDGGQQLGLPVVGNRLVDGYGERTDIVVRYDPGNDVEQDGHYVNFQQDAPKHQYGCLLQNLAADKVPVIVQGGGVNDACL